MPCLLWYVENMRQPILSEEDFDASPTQGEGRSPDIDLGSHLPNPLNSSMNVSVSPTPSDIILQIRKVPSGVVGGGAAPETVDKAVPSTTVADATPSRKKAKDQINNVRQKEEAMDAAGVTRVKTYEVIARLLGAKKWMDVADAGGNVRTEYVDDLEKQARGADMALKVMGDMIEHKQVEYGIADSTLEKLKALSVDTLRARAAELLEGRRKAVDVVERGVVVEAEVS